MNERSLSVLTSVFAGRVPRRAALARLAGGALAGMVSALGAPRSPRWQAAAQPATPPADASSFIVIRRYQLLPEASMDELVERVNDGFVPIVQTIPGFQEYLFVDAGDGAHLTMSLYDDPGGAELSTRDAAAWAAENVAALIEGPPEVVEGWVRIHVDADDSTAATPSP